MRVLFSDEPIIQDRNSIFLAGPTRRKSSFRLSWRRKACDILQAHDFRGDVYVPEFGHSENPYDFLNQATWERQCMDISGCIVFYICRELPDMPGFTTNFEFGRYLSLRPNATLLCTPEGAEKVNYLEWAYKQQKPEAIIYHDLDSVLEEAISVVNKNRYCYSTCGTSF